MAHVEPELVLRETQNWASRSHPELYAAVHNNNDPGQAGEIGSTWARYGSELTESAQTLTGRVAASEAGWTGGAADGARAALKQLADWLTDTAHAAVEVGSLLEHQGHVMADARANMPEPVAFSWEETLAAHSTGGLAGFTAAVADAQAANERSRAAHEQAVAVMTSMEQNSQTIDRTTPVFTAPFNPVTGETQEPVVALRAHDASGPGGAAIPTLRDRVAAVEPVHEALTPTQSFDRTTAAAATPLSPTSVTEHQTALTPLSPTSVAEHRTAATYAAGMAAPAVPRVDTSAQVGAKSGPELSPTRTSTEFTRIASTGAPVVDATPRRGDVRPPDLPNIRTDSGSPLFPGNTGPSGVRTRGPAGPGGGTGRGGPAETGTRGNPGPIGSRPETGTRGLGSTPGGGGGSGAGRGGGAGAPPLSAFRGGAGGAAGSAFGAGSAQSGAGSPTQPGGSTGVAPNSTQPGRGTGPSAGVAAGATGAPGGAPMGHGGGKSEEDKERKSPSYIMSGDLFDVPGADLPPAVIGDAKPKKPKDKS